MENVYRFIMILVCIFGGGTIVFFITLIVIAHIIRKREAKEIKKLNEENWRLPGQWEARTITQKDMLNQICARREWLLGEYTALPLDECFKQLEWVKENIQKHNLDPQLFIEFVKVMHSHYTTHKSWSDAIKIAQKYNL